MLILDKDSATIKWSGTGASPNSHLGLKHALLHLTKNANLSAGDGDVPDTAAAGDAISIEASILVKATPDETGIGSLEFGIVQVSQLHTYEFLYVGRLASEGSSVVNIKTGYTKNPSLDVQPNRGRSIDDEIFLAKRRSVTRAPGGFKVVVKSGDHPSNTIPLQFENRVTGAPNFLARAQRSEAFVAYFVARFGTTEPHTILARIGWAVTWDVDYTWSASTMTATKFVKTSLLFPGEPRIGAPDEGDPMAEVARTRSTPTTNDQDQAAHDAAWVARRAPILEQKRERPVGFRSDFFT
jgi:hypothetical protein